MARSMESADGGSNGGLVVTELSHIKELVRQLEAHLGGGSRELCRHLTTQIFSITERSISIITAASAGARKRCAAAADDDCAGPGLASPVPATPATSDVADGPFVRSTKKRKVMEKRKQQVRVSSPRGGAAENPAVDDGHSWRKYGQKEILGAKHPRGYYRCTHRHSQGCLATKQVQRTDEDPALFDVIYYGDHTCVQRPPPAVAAAGQPEQHNPDANSFLQSLTAGLTVQTEGLPALAADPPQGWSAAAPFHFSSSTPASVRPAPTERSPFSTSENWGVSPATSDSNHVASYLPSFEDAEWRGRNELQEVVSALVAASAPPAPVPVADGLDELLDMDDIESFFA